MKASLSLLLILFLLSCSKEPSDGFPKIYDFHGYDQSGQNQYLAFSHDSLIELSGLTGSFGKYNGELKMSSLDFILNIFDFREISLVNSDTLTVKYYYNGIQYNRIMSYELINGNIVISDSLSELLSYNKITDQFIVQGVTLLPISGINNNNPEYPNYQFIYRKYIPQMAIKNYGVDLLKEFTFETGDTLIIFIDKLFYAQEQ